ncbi:MAG: aldo/keto reductase, partial [Spirochaetaceae bacterium]
SYTAWAPGGTGGESEELVGEWLRGRPDRDEAFVSTKVGLPYLDVPKGLNPQVIRREIDRSLKRLRVDCIDLYLAHDDEPNQPIEETVGTFAEIAKAGKIRHYGICNHYVHRMAEAVGVSRRDGNTPITVVQMRYSYLRDNAWSIATPGRPTNVNLEVLLYCGAQNLPIMTFSALAKGVYTNPAKSLPPYYAGEDSTRRLSKLREVAGRLGVSPNALVLRWLRTNPYATLIPLFSASSVAQIEDNLAAAEIKMSGELWKELDSAGPPA